MSKLVADALMETLISPNELDQNLESANVVDGLFAIARSVEQLARAVERLGNADAATPMGGLEALGAVLRDGLAQVAAAIESDRS